MNEGAQLYNQGSGKSYLTPEEIVAVVNPIVDVSFDSGTGVFTFTKQDGSTITADITP